MSEKRTVCSKCNRPLIGTWCEYCVSRSTAEALGMKEDGPTGLLIPEPVALFDVDSTLADFEGAMRAAMVSMASPSEAQAFWNYHEQDKEPPYITARRRMVKKQPGFWRDLPRHPPGHEILDMAMLLGYDITIVTKAPRRNHAAWSEKVEWCHANLPMEYTVDGAEKEIKVSIVEEKGLVYGRVLVDDYPKYVLSWLKWRPRGLVIMPAQDHNKDFRHPNVIRYESVDDKPRVYAALRAQKLGQWKPVTEEDLDEIRGHEMVAGS